MLQQLSRAAEGLRIRVCRPVLPLVLALLPEQLSSWHRCWHIPVLLVPGLDTTDTPLCLRFQVAAFYLRLSVHLYLHQDCFPHGYYFFSYKIADTAVGANAINAVIGQVLHICIMPLVRPGERTVINFHCLPFLV